jgi:hypothetical protein
MSEKKSVIHACTRFGLLLAADAALPELPSDLPRGWGVNLSADRTRLVLSYARGTTILFR